MTAEEKQQVVGLLEEIALYLFRHTLLSSDRIVEAFNIGLRRCPIIPSEMRDDLKVREEG